MIIGLRVREKVERIICKHLNQRLLFVIHQFSKF